jgi:hypothetical protein
LEQPVLLPWIDRADEICRLWRVWLLLLLLCSYITISAVTVQPNVEHCPLMPSACLMFSTPFVHYTYRHILPVWTTWQNGLDSIIKAK